MPDLAALRAQMARLDHLALLNGQPPTAAYLPTEALRELLVNPPAGAVVTPLRQAPSMERQQPLEHELPLPANSRSNGPRPPQLTPPTQDPPTRQPIR